MNCTITLRLLIASCVVLLASNVEAQLGMYQSKGKFRPPTISFHSLNTQFSNQPPQVGHITLTGRPNSNDLPQAPPRRLNSSHSNSAETAALIGQIGNIVGGMLNGPHPGVGSDWPQHTHTSRIPRTVVIRNPIIDRPIVRAPHFPVYPPVAIAFPVTPPPMVSEPTIISPPPAPEPQPVVAPTAVISVPKAPTALLKPVRNANLASKKLKFASTEDALALRTDLESKVAETLDSLEKQLPNDSAVHALIEAAKTAAREGKSLDPAWLQQLKAAVNSAGGAINPSAANKLVKLVPGLIEASKVLANAIASSAGTSGLATVVPTGLVPVVVYPALPVGLTLSLPGNTLLVGTGGQGSVQVVSADAASILGVPVGSGAPVADVDPAFARTNSQGVSLRNPAENGAAIGFVLDSRTVLTLEPDYSQDFEDGVSHEVRFDRGSNRGEASYQLIDGTYAFRTSENGWDLFKESFSVAIDNSAGNEPFHYIVDNTYAFVAPGRTRIHKSKYPIMIRFNRGENGVDGAKRIASEGDRLSVAVNPADGLWDLFPAVSPSTLGPKNAAIASNYENTLAQPKSEGRLLTLLQQAGAKL